MPAKLLSPILGRGLLALMLFVMLLATPFEEADQHASKGLNDAFQRALITFGVARGLNALISVVQGTEVAIEPAGVGVILTPGQVLDPVNDLIERFSWVMLLSSTALGFQKVLLVMSGWLPLQIVVMVGLAAGIWLVLVPAALARPWRRVAFRAITFLVLLRFSIPLVALSNELIYQGFLEQQYEQSFAALDEAREGFEQKQAQAQAQAQDQAKATQVSPATQTSLLNKLKAWAGSTGESLNVSRRVDDYKQRLASISEHIIQLAVVFLLQTVIFPLLLFWVVWQTFRQMLGAIRIASAADLKV